MRQVLRAGALGRPRGMGWGRRREEGSGWGTHVNPWLIHVNVWQKSLQYCKVISLQLIKINEKKKKEFWSGLSLPSLRDLPQIGIEPMSPVLHSDALLLSHQEARIKIYITERKDIYYFLALLDIGCSGIEMPFS